MSTNTDVQIASRAMLLIGANALTSLSDHEAAEQLYLSTYRSLLTKRRWRFAMQKRALSRLVAAPLNQYQYAYQLPSDWLAISHVYPASDYEIFGDKIFTDATEVEIDYLVEVAEENLPPYFVECLELRLAAKFAIPVTGSNTKADLYYEQYKDQLFSAGTIDSQGRPPTPGQDSPFIAVRY